MHLAVARTLTLVIPLQLSQFFHKQQVSEPETAALKTTTSSPKKASSSLIPIKLRLTIGGVTVHDNFLGDLDFPVCPIMSAESIAKDLNLSGEVVVVIAICIVEQLNVVKMDNHECEPGLDGGPSSLHNTSVAWVLDQHVQVANSLHLVSVYHPKHK